VHPVTISRRTFYLSLARMAAGLVLPPLRKLDEIA
jgi:hypothetical protein